MQKGPIDQEVLDELREATGEDFLKELISTFLDEAPAMLAELREAAEQGDADRFRRAAHSIKSNAQTFGARPLAERARALELGDHAEQAAKGGAPQQAIEALESAYVSAAEALKGQLDG